MKQVCITIMLAMFMSMGGVMANGQVQRSINVATAGMLSDLISEDEKYQIEELTLSGELNGDDIFLIREMAGINMDNMNDYKYLGKWCLTAGKLRVLDLSDARIVEGGREYYKEKIGSVSFTGFTYTTNDEISACMFTYCSKLEELILPKSAKVISPRMMYGDASDKPEMNLKVLKVADGNPNYDSRDNCNAVVETATNTLVVGCNGSTIPDGVTSIGDYAFADCSGMTSVIIPNSVTTIGDYAFYNCSSLTSVIIPSSVTSISEFRAFYNCRGLESVTVHHTTPLAIYNGTFSWWNRDNYTDQKTSATLYVPVGTKTLYEAADGWKEFKNIAEDESIKVSPYKVGDKFIFDGVTYKVTSIDPLEVQVGDGNLGTPAIDKSTEGALELPASVIGIDGNSYSVTSISMGAFAGCKGLTSVTIPTSVTTIGNDVFSDCSSLNSIIVESENTIFDSRDNCNAIISTRNNTLLVGCKNTVIPNTVKFINNKAFYQCTGLISIEIPNSVVYIGNSAFEGCTGLTSVVIPNSLNSIEGNVFYGCSSLTSVTIPEGVTRIREGAFQNCSSLTSISIPNSVTTIEGSQNSKAFDGTAWYDNQPDGVVYAGKVAYTYKGTMPDNSEIVFDKGTTGITGYIFFGYTNLKSIIIPNSVIYIGDYAFYNCTSLTSVSVDINSPLAIGQSQFSNSSNATLYVPKGCKTAYESANYWKDFKNIEEDETLKGSPYKVGDKFIVDGVTYKVTSIDPLEVQVGNGDSSFGSIAIENSIEGAFEIPASVTAIDGNTYSVTAISKSAFSGCSGMTSVTIPSSVVTIAGGFDFGGSAFVGGAFENCGLTTLIIPSSVTSIGGGAFAGCSNLVSIVVEEGNAVYDSRDNCNAIIEKENNRLIAGCKNTKIPDGLIGITVGAFFGCKGLTSMDIPNSVTYISDYAFYGCNELTSLNISENVTSIGTQAFAYCSGLTSVTIPESVKTIWHDAFYGCSGLVSASILSKSMNRFGPHTYTGRYVGVFGKCDKLTTVIVSTEEPFAIGGNVLDNSANATLYVPKGSKAAYALADYWKEFKEIVEISPGDADGDGNVDQKDVNLVVEYIMNGKTEDLNLINATGSDRKVLNVADIVRIINIMKNK